MADPARRKPHEYVARAEIRLREIFENERFCSLVRDGDFHAATAPMPDCDADCQRKIARSKREGTWPPTPSEMAAVDAG